MGHATQTSFLLKTDYFLRKHKCCKIVVDLPLKFLLCLCCCFSKNHAKKLCDKTYLPTNQEKTTMKTTSFRKQEDKTYEHSKTIYTLMKPNSLIVKIYCPLNLSSSKCSLLHCFHFRWTHWTHPHPHRNLFFLQPFFYCDEEPSVS